MSGVLGQMRWPLCRRSKLCGPGTVPVDVDPRAEQLREAKEILAEVFGINPSEVDEMIRGRMDEGETARHEEKELWPEMLWIAI